MNKGIKSLHVIDLLPVSHGQRFLKSDFQFLGFQLCLLQVKHSSSMTSSLHHSNTQLTEYLGCLGTCRYIPSTLDIWPHRLGQAEGREGLQHKHSCRGVFTFHSHC